MNDLGHHNRRRLTSQLEALKRQVTEINFSQENNNTSASDLETIS